MTKCIQHKIFSVSSGQKFCMNAYNTRYLVLAVAKSFVWNTFNLTKEKLHVLA